jgi:hypothetical protein
LGEGHLDTLKTSVVVIGLNVSRAVANRWLNFHSRDHARKLMFAFNNSPYRGAYMTDLIKGEIEANSGRMSARIRNGKVDIQKHINTFRAEMHDVGVQQYDLFILFGADVTNVFTTHLARIYPNYVRCPHYSMYGRGYSDAEWVEKTWRTLEEHHEATKATFNTLAFVMTEMMTDQLHALRERRRLNAPRLKAVAIQQTNGRT